MNDISRREAVRVAAAGVAAAGLTAAGTNAALGGEGPRRAKYDGIQVPSDFRGREVPATKFYKENRTVPIVLAYQPATFIILKEPEDLRKWEANLRDKVGLKGIQVGAQLGIACETCSGGCSDACDVE